ncbi:type 2 periplasmic-binding domain-containing protein [Schleiferilactobacillus harbinensis]|uniref:Uncharacterized protein n=1 Tax=Schleiferilactobacillus harbinensis DSM 16991 TaxID=1122147 RepID=A0A0R1XD54_9LACO|nr:ABC transporter [Schleiferilactobacillus harbinensis]KRM27629.1 hypothetical protein FC91_GL002387 [Schleiferilactobacillus harbinensis DSM 16991]
MKMKKVLVALAAGLVCAMTLTACGNSNSSSNADSLPKARFTPNKKVPSWQKDTKHSASLTWYVNFDWYKRAGWGKDTVSAQIKKDMNIDVKFVAGNDDKLNTMMASGKLPDLVTFDRQLAVAQNAKKFALPLNTLSKKYDPYFLATAAKPQTVKWYTQPDGNLYTYPSFSTNEDDYKAGNVVADQVFIVRKDIYEKIGKPNMSTPEGFLKALQEAKKAVPKTDNGTALVPFASTALDIQNGGDGALGGTLQDFLRIPVTKDGKWYDRDADPEYLTWLDTFRQAYSEGLITNAQFADNDNTMKEKMTQGTYFAYLHSNTKGLNEFMADNNRRNPKQTYIAVDGPKNSKGQEPQFTGGSISGWTNTFITKNTKEPQKAMELLTYMASKYGTMVTTFGVKDKTYTMKDGQAVLTPDVEALRNKDAATYDKKQGMGSYWEVADDPYAISMGEKPATTISQMVEWASNKVAPRFEVENIDPTPGTALARNLTAINTDRVQTLVKVIKAGSKSEADKIWKDFLARRKNNNWDEIVKTRNEQVAKNIKKLK